MNNYATAPKSERFRGAIKWYNEEKGYGFIVPDSPHAHSAQPDIFLHVTALRAGRIDPRALYDGRRVEYSLAIPAKGPKKPAASDIKLLD